MKLVIRYFFSIRHYYYNLDRISFLFERIYSKLYYNKSFHTDFIYRNIKTSWDHYFLITNLTWSHCHGGQSYLQIFQINFYEPFCIWFSNIDVYMNTSIYIMKALIHMHVILIWVMVSKRGYFIVFSLAFL